MKLHPKGDPTHWLPCGKCLGCREIQQQQLTIRIKHEARYYTDNHFLTLTYDEEKCPDGLQKSDLQRFWKRIRRAQTGLLRPRTTPASILTGNPPKRTASNSPTQIRYLACGEYGDRTKRPHYHAAVLGLPISDLKKWDIENSRSDHLERTWGNGIVTISELTEDRIRYVAGYVLKKAGYQRQVYCTEDGEELQAPYRDMSKGLGKRWVTAYQNDLRNGYLEDNGNRFTIPRYYREQIKSTNEPLAQYIQQQQHMNWEELTEMDRKLLHNAEKIRQKEIREGKTREQV